MESQKSILVVFACFCLQGCLTQNTRVTYTSKLEEVLSCPISANVFSAQWSVTLGDGTLSSLFAYNGDPDKIYDGRAAVDPAKYNNFEYELANDTFDLVIRNVDKDDGGEYVCTVTPGNGPATTVTVEVVGVMSTHYGMSEVTILTVNETEAYPVTCSSTGAKVLNGLSLMWSFENTTGSTLNSTNADDANLTDYTTTASYIADRDDKNITCSSSGYQAPGIDERDLTATMSLIVQYRPECELTESSVEGNCSVVTLTCDCSDAVPEVEESDYRFYRNGSLINGTGSNRTVVVGLDEPTKFSCSASNAVGDSVRATTDEDYLCRPSCTSSSCQNGGTCNPLGPRGGYSCTCKDFYIGDDCGIETACAASPCKNSGICQYNSTGDDYSCDCRGSYSGPNCTIPPPGFWGTALSYIVGAVIVVCIIIVIFLFCCWYCNRKGSKDPGSGNGTLVSYQDHNATCNPAYTEDFGAPNNGNVVVDAQVMEVKSRKSGNVVVDAQVMEVKSRKSRNVAADSEDPSALYGKIDKSRQSKKTTEAPRDPHVPSPEKPGPRGDANRRPTETKPEEPSKAAPKSKAAAADVELQYADLDHGRAPPSKKVHQPQDEPTAYAEVNFRLVEV